MYLFGSHARGEARPTSDVDLAVLLDPHTTDAEAWKTRLELGAKLSEALGREVDLFILGEGDLDLTFRVIQKPQRVFERNRDQGRYLEAYWASRFYDYQPFLEQYLAATARHFNG